MDRPRLSLFLFLCCALAVGAARAGSDADAPAAEAGGAAVDETSADGVRDGLGDGLGDGLADGLGDGFPDGGAGSAVPVIADLAAADVVVFSGDELIRRGFRTLGEALAFEAGFVRSRAAGSARYTLRGIDDGVALLIDGVPLIVDGERNVIDVDDVLDLAEVERVEIVKGPSTSIAGPQALTGTVRVTSRRPGLTGASLRTSGTALLSSTPAVLSPLHGERLIAASAQVREGALAARVSARLQSGAEQLWRLRAVPVRFERVAGVALAVSKADVDVVAGEDTTLNLRAAVVHGDALFDVVWSHDLEQQPLSGFSHGLLDEPQTQTRDLVRARALWQGQLAGVHVAAALTGAHHERGVRIPLFPRRGLFNDGGLLAVDSAADSVSALGRADLAVTDGHHLLFALFGDVTRATASSTATDPISGARSNDVVTFDDASGSANAAVEYQGDFGGGLHATAGLVAFWRTSFQPGLSPRAALLWRVEGLDVDASYSEGVRAPDRFDVQALAKAVVDGRVVGAAANPGLRPELVRTLQLGAGFSPSAALRLSGRVFGLRHEDAVVGVVDGALLRPENLPPRLLAGGELAAEVAPLRDLLHLRGGLSAVAVVDDGAPARAEDEAGDDPDERDALQAVVDGNVTPLDGWTLGARGRAALRAPANSAVLDLYGSAAVDRIVVVVAVKNAFDALELAVDREAPPFAEPVRYPGAGRSLTVSVEGRF